MSNWKKFFIAIAPAMVCLSAWLGGFDFDTRGSEAAMVFAISLAAIFFVWGFPE